MQTGSSTLLFRGSGRYSKSFESSSGNKSLKVGMNWTTGISDISPFNVEIAASISGLRSGATITSRDPVLLMRFATAAAEFLGEIAKATHSARMMPSSVAPYVIVSRRKCIKGQYSTTEEREASSLTRVGQQGNYLLHPTNLRFRKSESTAKVVARTVDSTDPRGESNLFTLPRTVLVDIRDMVGTARTMEIDHFRNGQTQVMRGRNECGAGESLSWRRERDSHGHSSACRVGLQLSSSIARQEDIRRLM